MRKLTESVEDRIRKRIGASERSLVPHRKKVHRLRGIVAGDPQSSEARAPGSQDETWQTYRPFAPEYGDFFVEEAEDVRSNDMQQALRTLIFSTTYTFPDIESDDLSAAEALIDSQYLQSRLGERPFGCNAAPQMMLGLMEYALGGLGGVYTCLADDAPMVQQFDTLDFTFDRTARVVEDITWGCLGIRKPWWYWREFFHEVRLSKFAKEMVSEDAPAEMRFYYDIEGAKGRYIVFLCTGNTTLHENPVVSGENPCYYELEGARLPFLPFVLASFLSLPSVRLPVGLADAMLPSQRAIWEAETTQDKKIKRMRDFYQSEEGALSKEQKRAFQEDGEIASLVERKSGTQPITITAGPQMTSGEADYRAFHERKLVAMSGANPYASGAPVEDTKFAREVNAIERFSSLMSGVIGRDNSRFWGTMVRQVVALGKLGDKKPFVARLPRPDGEVDRVVFGADDPVSRYLVPEARRIVREDTMVFVPRAEQKREAAADVELGLKVETQFPNFLNQALEKYLRASREKNIGKWLERPAPRPAPASGAGMAPGLPVPGMSGQGMGAGPESAAMMAATGAAAG